MKSARLDRSVMLVLLSLLLVPSLAIMVSTEREDKSFSVRLSRWASWALVSPPPNSFSMTAIRLLCWWEVRMFLTRVVFPERVYVYEFQ